MALIMNLHTSTYWKTLQATFPDDQRLICERWRSRNQQTAVGDDLDSIRLIPDQLYKDLECDNQRCLGTPFREVIRELCVFVPHAAVFGVDFQEADDTWRSPSAQPQHSLLKSLLLLLTMIFYVSGPQQVYFSWLL